LDSKTEFRFFSARKPLWEAINRADVGQEKVQDPLEGVATVVPCNEQELPNPVNQIHLLLGSPNCLASVSSRN
jgi:hypothetical protein